jgi:hypothetical protein
METRCVQRALLTKQTLMTSDARTGQKPKRGERASKRTIPNRIAGHRRKPRHINHQSGKVCKIEQRELSGEIGLTVPVKIGVKMSEKFLLIRPATDVHDAIVRAARGRQMVKCELIERLLTHIVHDNLIDAVMDDRQYVE